MISFKVLLAGLLVLISIETNAADFFCSVPLNFQNLSCEGSVTVTNLTDLIAYKTTLNQKKGKAKNLIINFDVNTNALTISTPCKITFAERRSFAVGGDLCLHGGSGVEFSESTNLRANYVRLESNKLVVIENHVDIKTDNLEFMRLLVTGVH
jgi:hypothetical protein